MTLEELKQVKKDRENGVIVSNPKWHEVLDWAIALTAEHEAGKVAKNASDD